MRFFTGLHQPSDAGHFNAAFISVNRLRGRKGPFEVGDWIMDSGAFSELSIHGKYRFPVEEYAEQIKRWRGNGRLLAAVAQDYMCEPFILQKTGLTIPIHQRLTIERYDILLRCETGCYIMPVLQGYAPEDYVAHLLQYGERIGYGAWVGVGSVCKRNSNPEAIKDVLEAILTVRPDLKLHGFGLKLTALSYGPIRDMLFTADSMAWSYSARMKGRNGNSWLEALAFTEKVETCANLKTFAPPLTTFQMNFTFGERTMRTDFNPSTFDKQAAASLDMIDEQAAAERVQRILHPEPQGARSQAQAGPTLTPKEKKVVQQLGTNPSEVDRVDVYRELPDGKLLPIEGGVDMIATAPEKPQRKPRSDKGTHKPKAPADPDV